MATNIAIALVGESVATRSAAASLQRLMAAGQLTRFVEAVQTKKPADGMTSCHEHAAAFANDLQMSGVSGWCVVLGRTAKIDHSWLECGDAAVDVTLDRPTMIGKIMVAEAGWYRSALGIVTARGFDTGNRKDLQAYMRLVEKGGGMASTKKASKTKGRARGPEDDPELELESVLRKAAAEEAAAEAGIRASEPRVTVPITMTRDDHQIAKELAKKRGLTLDAYVSKLLTRDVLDDVAKQFPSEPEDEE